MKKPAPPVVKRSLFWWVLAGNLKLQMVLLVIIIITVFARVVPLEMQKRVVNEAIKLRNTDLLIMYCGIYLVAVVTASGLKFAINYLQTLIGQRATAGMRKDLYHHIIALPLVFFRNTQPGMVVSSLITELTVPGNFVGMAIAVPVTNLLTLAAFAAYLIWLNPLLAGVSLSIYPIVLVLVPMLQRGANRANKRRVDTTRVLSSKIAESISGIQDIQSNGAFAIENRKFDQLVDRLLKIRVVWTLYRGGIKITNNFFTSLGPFLIFIIGGYLTIRGQLGLGALVAFLSAQEKLYDPWRELIEFYQAYQEASVNYYRTMSYFNLAPEHIMLPEGRRPYDLDARIKVNNLSFVTDSGIRLLDRINLSLDSGEHLALVGFSGSGKSTLALCVGQLYKYTSGQVLIGEREVSALTKKDIVQNIGFVSQSPFIFDGTIQENLLYSSAAQLEENGIVPEDRLPSLDDMIGILQQTGIFVDVLRFGLNTVLSADRHQDFIDRLIRVRENFRQQFGKELRDYVEFFEEDRYHYFSSISENLVFGAPNRQEFANRHLPANPKFIEFLDRSALMDPLLRLGAELAERAIDIIGLLPPEEIFFEQSPIAMDELDEYKELVSRLKSRKPDALTLPDQRKLLVLALRFTPGQHKMVALSEKLESLILEKRGALKQWVLENSPEAFSFYQVSEYIYSQTILNNIFFGKTKTANPNAQEKINQSIIHLLIEEDFLETVLQIGMQYPVGTQGERLSGGQRQKLAIARALIKAPKILIMDEATSALDNTSQARIQNLLETRWKGQSTLIAVVHRLDTIQNYDRIAVMKGGKISEIGTYDELMSAKGILYELIIGRK